MQEVRDDGVDPRRPDPARDPRRRLATGSVGVAVGMGVNVVSNDVGYRGVAVAFAVAALGFLAWWLGRLPTRSPLVTWVSRVLILGALACAVAAAAVASTASGYLTIGAAALVGVAVAVNDPWDAFELLAASALIGFGVAVLGYGVENLRGGDLDRGIMGAVVGLTAVAFSAVFTSLPNRGGSQERLLTVVLAVLGVAIGVVALTYGRRYGMPVALSAAALGVAVALLAVADDVGLAAEAHPRLETAHSVLLALSTLGGITGLGVAALLAGAWLGGTSLLGIALSLAVPFALLRVSGADDEDVGEMLLAGMSAGVGLSIVLGGADILGRGWILAGVAVTGIGIAAVGASVNLLRQPTVLARLRAALTSLTRDPDDPSATDHPATGRG